MKRSKLIFLVAALIFVLSMIGITIHMASQTTPPWEKKKEILDKYKLQ